MLKRWWHNIRWLFNQPPTCITQSKTLICDYCGEAGCCWEWPRIVTFCANCQKKVFDKILKEDEK